MRLRLNVQRHGLPPSLVVWVTGDPKRTPKNTVSQLLENLNDVIPLESGDWGLEDYVVEINGYECLHFQELGSVFREDDEVCIRPLLSPDLRARKISGRHQISHAGRHLIDGVPFGRPFFKRAADRPVLEIPPRKRRRLTDDDGNGLDGAEAGRQLMNRSAFADIDLDDDDDYGDSEFSMGSDSDGSVLADQGSEAALGGYGNGYDLRHRKRASNTNYRKHELILSNGQPLPLIDRDGKPFPGRYSNALLDYFTENRSKPGQNAGAKGSGGIQECDYNSELGKAGKEMGGVRSAIRRSSFPLCSRSPFQGRKSVRFPSAEVYSSDAESVDLDERSDDEEFQNNESSNGTESDVQDEDEAGSESSKSDSETDSETSDQSSSSSSNESIESKPEEVSSRPLIGGSLPKQHAIRAASHVAAPGMGLTSTKRRNQRRRISRRLAHLKKTGQLPPDATHSDFRQYLGGTLRMGSGAENANSGTSLATVSLEAKREELLASITSGGVEVGRPGRKLDIQETTREEIGVEKARGSDMSLPSEALTSDTPAPRSRAKLDIASSRRMLFSSLGFRNPKTEEDEVELRLRIAKTSSNDHHNQKCVNLSSNAFASGHTAPVLVERLGGTDKPMNQADEDDHWKDKIALKAVECCYDGVDLSTPPFPFRQRWDPHQRRYQKQGKRKKRKRNRIQYYEDDNEYHDFPGGDISNSGGLEQDIQLNYDEHQGKIVQDSMGVDSDSVDRSLDEQIARETGGKARSLAVTVDDLPELPADISFLPNFVLSMAQPGAVIAFKQLTISEDWQPHICGYRTAEVVAVADGTALELSLARRDITTRSKKFDEKSGERIWGKFEMPDANEEAEPGSLSLDFSELIDPKLVRQPRTASPAGTRKAVREMEGEVDQPLSSPAREEAADEPPNSFLDPERGGRSTPSMTRGQGGEDMSENLSPSQPLDPGREDNGPVRVLMGEGHHSSNTSASSHESQDLASAGGERGDDTGHDISQLIRDAGFESTVVSLFLPSPLTLGHGEPDGQTRSKLPVDAPNQMSAISPQRPPGFSGLSSSPVPEDRESTEPANSVKEQPLVHEDTEQFDHTIASVGYPKLPEIETSPHPPANLDNHLIGVRTGSCGKPPYGEQHSSSDILTADHRGDPQKVPGALPSEEVMLHNEACTDDDNFSLAGENVAEESPKADSSSSEKDYPSFEELIASGRPPVQRVKEERASTPRLLETEKDLALNTSSAEIRNRTPTIKTGSQSSSGSQLPTESRAPNAMDLTVSPPTRIEADEDEDDLGLPLGLGWVLKKRTTLGGAGGTSRRRRRSRDVYSLG